MTYHQAEGIGRGNQFDPPSHGRFQSAKTDGVVHFRRRWHLAGLRALSLDASVSVIGPYHGETRPPTGVETVVRVETVDGSIVVGFARDPISIRSVGALPFVLFTRAMVEREPRRTTIASIWSTRTVAVDPADRVRVLRSAGDAGASLAALASEVRRPFADPIHAILRLVFEGELALDIDDRLRPETLVRRWSPRRPATAGGRGGEERPCPQARHLRTGLGVPALPKWGIE